MVSRRPPAGTVAKKRVGIPCGVVFRDGEWHSARLLARWRDRRGREVLQLEWFAGLDAWSGEFLAEPGKIRER